MPSLQQLLAFEATFEPALATYLNQNQAAVAAAVYPEFSDTEKITPFVEVRLDGMKPSGDHRQFLTPVNGQRSPASDIWKGTLIMRVVTARGKNSDQHADIVGWLRAKALNMAADFDKSSLLPNHSIYYIAPVNSPRGVDPELGIDFTELQYDFSIAIASPFSKILT